MSEKGSKKSFIQWRDFMRKQIYRKGKNLAFSEDACVEKERVRSKVTPRKVEVGLKQRRELSKRKWRIAWWRIE